MHIPLVKRIIVCIFNILFPPFAVASLTGVTSRDTFINSCLFLLAVIPSHVHGFMISMTYFSRKRKVRKGRFPGGEKPLIYSEKVLTGGAGWKEYDRLRREERRRSGKGGSRKQRSRHSSYADDRSAKEIEEWRPPLPAR